MRCPRCKTEYQGNFCPKCGAFNGGTTGLPGEDRGKVRPVFYRQWQFWLVCALLLGVILAGAWLLASVLANMQPAPGGLIEVMARHMAI